MPIQIFIPLTYLCKKAASSPQQNGSRLIIKSPHPLPSLPPTAEPLLIFSHRQGLFGNYGFRISG